MSFARRLGCVGLLLLVEFGGAEAQKATETPTFRTSAEMVLVPITVTDHDGKIVDGLRADDFNVFDSVLWPIARAAGELLTSDQLPAESL